MAEQNTGKSIEPMDALLEGLSKLRQEELYKALCVDIRTLNESQHRLNGILKSLEVQVAEDGK